MKRTDMIDIRNSRRNVVDFLHRDDIAFIEAALGDGVKLGELNWLEACNAVIAAYDEKRVKNAVAEKLIIVLAESNCSMRTPKFRQDGAGGIYKYDASHDAYLWHCNGGNKDYCKLVGKHGEYAD